MWNLIFFFIFSFKKKKLVKQDKNKFFFFNARNPISKQFLDFFLFQFEEKKEENQDWVHVLAHGSLISKLFFSLEREQKVI